jgi:hypothetical protein
MSTLHFSYSSGGHDLDTCDEPLMSPYTITWHMHHFLRQKAAEMGYDYHYQNLDDITPCTFGPDDIVIGHCWWDGGFMHQALASEAKHKFILQPYSHAMVSVGDVPMVKALFAKADHLFLITGDYWWQTIDTSPYADLKPRATRLDKAINPAIHPYSKTRWNKPGERAICTIGADVPTKGYKHVTELARVAGLRYGHFGSARPETFEHVPCMTLHGGMLFTPDNIAKLCANYDGLVVIPEADANPTVLLEAASWGLSVFCTREAGYLPHKPFFPLHKNDTVFNVKEMRLWQQADEYELASDSRGLRSLIERSYSWQKFTQTLWSKVSEYL